MTDGTTGPVGLTGDTLNGTKAADGSPQASSVIVTFDRPVDPSSFTAGGGTADVTVFTTDFESGAAGFYDEQQRPRRHRRHRRRRPLAPSRPRPGQRREPHGDALFYYGRGESAAGGGNYNSGSANWAS
ncbi:MAG: hypothetical protein U0835_10180 [Isosphaeraceae bacterium]